MGEERPPKPGITDDPEPQRSRTAEITTDKAGPLALPPDAAPDSSSTAVTRRDEAAPPAIARRDENYPNAQLLAEFEAVLPGSGDRLLAMAEEQAAHRRAMEARAQEGQIALQKAGMRHGLALGIATLVAVTTLYLGGQGSAAWVLITAFASQAVAAAFGQALSARKPGATDTKQLPPPKEPGK